MDEIFKKYSLDYHLNVSRETCVDFEQFINMITERNKDINLISKESCKNENIRLRHVIDSAQIIDFIDLNCSTTSDLGTGGGFPGIIIAIMLKNMKKKIKVNLYEKSHHKSAFLKEVSRKLNLDTEIIQNDIFEAREKNSGTIMARAFKPLSIVIELVYKNFRDYENLVLFMGKTGEHALEETLKNWVFDFERKKSITSNDSFLLNIRNIKKKF